MDTKIREYIIKLGKSIKQIRLLEDISCAVLSERAGISKSALYRLENGHGATVKTLISVLYVLGKTDWLNILYPQITVNPLNMTKAYQPQPRKRASRKT